MMPYVAISSVSILLLLVISLNGAMAMAKFSSPMVVHLRIFWISVNASCPISRVSLYPPSFRVLKLLNWAVNLETLSIVPCSLWW